MIIIIISVIITIIIPTIITIIKQISSTNFMTRYEITRHNANHSYR
jgi:hypothetical protein